MSIGFSFFLAVLRLITKQPRTRERDSTFGCEVDVVSIDARLFDGVTRLLFIVVSLSMDMEG